MKIAVILMILASIPKCPRNELSIEGMWINSEDKNYILKITRDTFYEIYKSDTSVYKYSRSSTSCDKKYYDKTNPSLDFLSLDDGRCFEITGISDSTLAYRHTVSGKIKLFNKVRKPY